MKVVHNIYLACFVLIISLCIFAYALYDYSLSPASSSSKEIVVTIEPGSIRSIANTLMKKKLIKNEYSFILYTKISGKTNLKAADYVLSRDMGVKKIVDVLYKGEGSNTSQLKITFKEGINIRKIVGVLVENTNHTEEEIYQFLSNEVYLNELIQEYWFLGDEILNDKIYYNLEGYLYPNTYYFTSEDAPLEEIFKVMLDETDKQFSPYKEQLEQNSMSIHEIFTLASIVELEGVTDEDRKGIASVFFNRLDSKMTLGSDVTTYYGVKVDMGERDLYASEIKECNDYNTRCASFAQLPISPICNPILESVLAVLNPADSSDYYFVADKNKKIYFSRTINEHNATINSLKKNDLWYEY